MRNKFKVGEKVIFDGGRKATIEKIKNGIYTVSTKVLKEFREIDLASSNDELEYNTRVANLLSKKQSIIGKNAEFKRCINNYEKNIVAYTKKQKKFEKDVIENPINPVNTKTLRKQYSKLAEMINLANYIESAKESISSYQRNIRENLTFIKQIDKQIEEEKANYLTIKLSGIEK